MLAGKKGISPGALNKFMENKEKTYTCPMHSEIKQNKPGRCPKCGMKLIEKKMKVEEEKINYSSIDHG